MRIYAGVNVVDTRRSYDGEGREGKRERTIWIDDEINYPNPPYGYWHEEDDVYYIRSSILGGEVVSETGPTGKKKMTFVYAAGAKIATQNVHVYESTTYKSVSFHLADSSGQSQRTTNSSGTVYNFGGNYDGAPVEADPMGGNMGVETPYVEEPLEPLPTPDFPAFEVNEADPVYVNGIRVSGMTLDGMTVSYAVGRSMLETGVAMIAPENQVAGIWSNSQNRYVGLAVWNPVAAQNGIGFLGPNSLGFIPVGVDYRPGVGLFGTNVTNWFPRLGTDNPHNFISERSVQLYSAVQGIATNNTNFQSSQTQRQTVEDLIKSIFDRAREALNTPKKDPFGLDCADLFGGKGLEFLEAYEKSIGRNRALRFGDKDADGKKFTPDHFGATSRSKTTTIGREKFSVITFNTTTQLYNSDTYGFSENLSDYFGHLSFVDFWAAALLHEIGHAIRNKYGSIENGGGLIDPDGNSAAESTARQRFVVEHCFPKP